MAGKAAEAGSGWDDDCARASEAASRMWITKKTSFTLWGALQGGVYRTSVAGQGLHGRAEFVSALTHVSSFYL